MRIAVVYALAALLLAGCTAKSGRDFPIPMESQLRPGQTTSADVKAMFGEPDTSSSFVSSGGEVASQQPNSEFDAASIPGAFDSWRYRFVKRTVPVLGSPATGGDLSAKFAVFAFRNNILIGYNSTSNFADHQTNFDETKVTLLKKGQTTRAEAEAILGPPTGQAIYPMVLNPGQYKVQYNFGTADLQARKELNKELVLLFDTNDRLLDYRVRSSISNLPVAPAPTVVPAPVIIPTFHK